LAPILQWPSTNQRISLPLEQARRQSTVVEVEGSGEDPAAITNAPFQKKLDGIGWNYYPGADRHTKRLKNGIDLG
jgi:hypothetical protein